MSIGIIGAGQIGTALAQAFARAHIEVSIANSRGPDSLRDLQRSLAPWVVPVTRQQAAAADVVIVAVNWSKTSAALADLGPWNGRIVVDANNPIEAPTFKPFNLGGRTSTEVFSDLVPGARVVKAFNHLAPHLLGGDPTQEGGRRVLFYSGDDSRAKGTVGKLIERLGFLGLDMGHLATGGALMQFPGGALPGHNVVRFA
jgi:predicted dinucleotide-binding enzyme